MCGKRPVRARERGPREQGERDRPARRRVSRVEREDGRVWETEAKRGCGRWRYMGESERERPATVLEQRDEGRERVEQRDGRERVEQRWVGFWECGV